jgi:hypothetical protein
MTVVDLIKENENIRDRIKGLNLRLNRLIDRKTMEAIPMNANSYRLSKNRNPDEILRVLECSVLQTDKNLDYYAYMDQVLDKKCSKIRDPEILYKLDEQIDSFKRFDRIITRDIVTGKTDSERLTKKLTTPALVYEEHNKYEAAVMKFHELKKTNTLLEKQIHKTMEEIGCSALEDEELNFLKKTLQTKIEQKYKAPNELKGNHDTLSFKVKQ